MYEVPIHPRVGLGVRFNRPMHLSKMMHSFVILLRLPAVWACLATGGGLHSAPPPLAPAPPMGWNSWNWHGKKPLTEQLVLESIDAMVAHGLRDAGYTYIVVDGGWRDSRLGTRGELVPNPVKFPRGIKHLADYAHARGFKFGLHTVPGTHDCGGDPVGGFGREEIHVRQLVEWGVDLVKLDRCQFKPDGWDEPKVEQVYRRWARLLAESGRKIVFSISAYQYRPWYPEICHMARTTYDIRSRIHGGAVFDDGTPADPKANFISIVNIAELNNRWADHAGNGFWNDPDMLVTGDQGLTLDEQKSHFALWCIMSSPLMLGNDPRVITAEEKAIILNPEAIAINQDPTEQGRRIESKGSTEVWRKQLRDGRVAILLINRDKIASQPVTFSWKDGSSRQGSSTWQVRDVFGRVDLGTFDSAITRQTPPHGCWLLLFSPQ